MQGDTKPVLLGSQLLPLLLPGLARAHSLTGMPEERRDVQSPSTDSLQRLPIRSGVQDETRRCFSFAETSVPTGGALRLYVEKSSAINPHVHYLAQFAGARRDTPRPPAGAPPGGAPEAHWGERQPEGLRPQPRALRGSGSTSLLVPPNPGTTECGAVPGRRLVVADRKWAGEPEVSSGAV